MPIVLTCFGGTRNTTIPLALNPAFRGETTAPTFRMYPAWRSFRARSKNSFSEMPIRRAGSKYGRSQTGRLPESSLTTFRSIKLKFGLFLTVFFCLPGRLGVGGCVRRSEGEDILFLFAKPGIRNLIKNGAPERIRTSDTRIRSPLLYPG